MFSRNLPGLLRGLLPMVGFLGASILGVALASAASLAGPALAASQRCPESSVNGDVLIQKVRALVTHGDLRNVGSVEQALGTHLRSVPSSDRSAAYQAESVFDLPIEVQLYLSPQPANKNGSDTVAFFRLEDQPWPSIYRDLLPDCLHITSNDFARYWGTSFRKQAAADDPSLASASSEIPGGAGTHAAFIIADTYRTKDDLVIRLTIRQLQ